MWTWMSYKVACKHRIELFLDVICTVLDAFPDRFRVPLRTVYNLGPHLPLLSWLNGH